ncbi:hypothetical protein SERLA73DRAFT_185632 [Serpula lacrymans var. lacrymans S7.3]|uniref:Geranylgeranyl transferase type-2 subunit alpha n=2 Tax=Serpula lacrymans var. lacrymans TaxID=341189 RepID=F8Q656_SERL3|nr:uncharacterized protein SERLADRAFT_474204 [Serpula lacrymans var. lacrymans S7.9]EGN96094.1 hypothetical protein SERLA73DRAFT_185632 [Serpula lacrymans var. lacrymans S7.3]EGO21614.1 hypothetical protein SERLADRAFT_474204 [Serpula lacrymans var. lacrymans S7.9]
MHSGKRVRQTPAAIEARKQREKSKIQDYLALTREVTSRKKSRDFSTEALDLTQTLLQLNPEFYTIWNYRRNILLHGLFPNSSPEGINDLLSSELSMTTAALKANPKVYGIWNYRRWCLENVPDGPETEDGLSHSWKKAKWDRELYVVERMLDADGRNFHAWNYRRYVLAMMPTRRPEASELAYTTRKIEANFSNFSAWHQRSKILSSLWNDVGTSAISSREDEFEFVRNALYTDPDDQSAWIYHRWLVGSGQERQTLEREIGSIEELLKEQPDSKWCLESLVHYQRLLLRNNRDENSKETAQKCLGFLLMLQEIDPARRSRYKEIGGGNSRTKHSMISYHSYLLFFR